MYAPGIQDQSGQLFAQGFSRGIADLGRAIEQKGIEDKRTYDNGKIADSMVKANPELLGMLGQSPEEFSAMSARDRHAAVIGIIQGAAVQETLKRQQMLGLQLEEAKREEAARRSFQTGFAPDGAAGAGAGAGGNGAAVAMPMSAAPMTSAAPQRITAFSPEGSKMDLTPTWDQPGRPGPGMPRRFDQPGPMAMPMAGSGVNAARLDPRAVLYDRAMRAGLRPEEALKQIDLYEATHAAEPGTLADIPGAPGYKYLIQGRHGEGSPLVVDPSQKLISPMDRSRMELNAARALEARKNAENAGKEVAPAEPWILSDDPEIFKSEIVKVKDPKQRDAILKTRASFNAAMGKSDPLAQMLGAIIGEDKPGAKARGTPPPGERLPSAPVTHRFNVQTGQIEKITK